jgi:cytochrome P450
MTAQLAGTDPFTATAAGARHAAYAALAAAGPVHRIVLPSGAPAWLVLGYDEARAALADPRLSDGSPRLVPPGADRQPAALRAAMTRHVLNVDPPDHTRLRRLVSSAFTRPRIELLGPRIQQAADDLLDAIADCDRVDLIETFAYPLPITVICELLDVPTDRQAQFRDWTTTIVAGSLADPQALLAAHTAMIEHVRAEVAAKRVGGEADGLLSALVAVHDVPEGSLTGPSIEADRLSEDELTSMVLLLLLAGHETTVNLIGNGVHALLTHPAQLALLRAEPERLGAAVEELLRFAGPLQLTTPRVTVEPVEIGGVAIPAGELVVPGLLAANRDAAHIAEPDVLDLTRPERQHLAFGYGVHHCLGAPLARLEGRIALGSLLARFPDLRLAVPAAELVWRPSVLMHGLTALPVALQPPEPGGAR